MTSDMVRSSKKIQERQMSDLGSLVDMNYQLHPSFQFKSEAFRVDESMVKQFDIEYGNPKSMESESEILERLSRLTNLAKSVFKQMSGQSSEKGISLFLQELELRFLNYLNEEFTVRKKVTSNVSRIQDREEFNLLQKNLHFYGTLSEYSCKKILSIAEVELQEFRKRADQGFLERKDLSVNSGGTVRKICNEIEKNFHKMGIFKIISAYFQVPYDHVGLSLELSDFRSLWWRNALKETSAPRTMYAHLDETFFAPKAIVYLSEVEDRSGPTKLYPKAYRLIQNPAFKDIVGRVIGSIVHNPEVRKLYDINNGQLFSSQVFREHFMKLPELIRFNSHFGWDVQPNSELEEDLASMEEVFLGKPGDFIIFDGAQLLHRGGLIESGQRVVLQVVFQVSNPKVRKRVLMNMAQGKLLK